MDKSPANASQSHGPRDLGEEAYEGMRQAIQNRELPSGTRIFEKDMCDRLGMSRTPVREAIYRLEAEGLLTHEPRRGLSVSTLDHAMVLELYTMRERLEGAAAAFAAQHASEAEIAMMETLVEDEARSADDADRLDKINRSLHGLIHVSAHNRFLVRTLANLATTAALLPTMLSEPDRVAKAHTEHVAMINAIANRDHAGAEEATRSHIRSARRLRLKFIAEELARDRG